MAEKSQEILKKTNVILWLQTIRPKTLTAAIVPFLTGAALAYSEKGSISWVFLFSALLAALCIQIATNVINDAFDFIKGADNSERLGPKRALQQGFSTEKQVFFLGFFFFFLALFFSIPLIIHGGLPILLILSISIASGYLYTGGPYPLAYQGLGDPFVIIFFGWVATISGYWLQTGELSPKAFLLGTQIGLLCTVLIAINNYRDIISDEKVDKKTLAVRFGPIFAKYEIAFLALTPFILNLVWLAWEYYAASTLPFITLPLALWIVCKVWKTPPSSVYNFYLGMATLLHLSFSSLLLISFVFNPF